MKIPWALRLHPTVKVWSQASKLYIQALKDNLYKQFDGNPLALTVFKMFDPMPVFEKNIAGFKTYSVAEVGILTDNFHQGLQAPYQEVH